ncbi:Uncharacterised protein [Bordetella pertussis]|nr:Uncharacterised protein [Bordetella pertussis]
MRFDPIIRDKYCPRKRNRRDARKKNGPQGPSQNVGCRRERTDTVA